MTSVRAALLVATCLLAAGCMGAAGKTTAPVRDPLQPYTEVAVKSVMHVEAREPACNAAGCTEFYHVRIHGSENATRIEGEEELRSVCTKPWSHSVVLANQSILYHPSRYTFDWKDLNTIVTENFWGVSVAANGITEGCPTSYGLRAFYRGPGAPYPSFNRPMGSFGAVKFTVYRDGLIAFEGAEEPYFVGIGQKIVVSYARQRVSDDATYLVKGGFEIVNLGPWAKDRVYPAADGNVTRGPG